MWPFSVPLPLAASPPPAPSLPLLTLPGETKEWKWNRGARKAVLADLQQMDLCPHSLHRGEMHSSLMVASVASALMNLPPVSLLLRL